MGVGDGSDDREAQSGARVTRGVAVLEDLLALLDGNSGPVVREEKAASIGERPDLETYRRAPMLDAVPKEVLEERLETASVGLYRPGVRAELQLPFFGLDVLPRRLGDRLERDGLGLDDGLALTGQREDVFDDPLHPIVSGLDFRESVLVALLGEELEIALRDREGVPEIVTEDACELL